MLSHNVLATPRPRPPAKARRSPSLTFPPPPPYAPRLEVLLDSPIGVTTQLLGSAISEESDTLDQGVDEWMNEKSKEELSGLLLKADGLIKERETELGLTSALVKSLYQDNIALKTKHEALLSRLPSTASRTPSPPVLVCSSPLAQSPHYYSASLPRTPIDSPASRSPPLSRSHHRRISVTPAEIALLADQNAELLDKLEKLEEESERNDQHGRRKLRKLEREIQGLKEELELTQAKEQEMAEKAKVLGEAESQRKKEEREEKLRSSKEQATPEPDSLDDVRDFAPATELPWSGSLKGLPDLGKISSSAPPPMINMSTRPIPTDSSLLGCSLPPLPARSPTPRPEYALIAQLLHKIQELEETNTQINEEQRSTEDRYWAAQRDADSIRRAYDCLEDDSTDVRVLDAVPPSLPPSGYVEETVKFSSLRRNIDGDIESSCLDGEVEEEDFMSGISDDMRSTTRNLLPPPGNKSAGGHKSRKSVVGLFDSPESFKQDVRKPMYPDALNVSPSFRSGDALRNDLADMSTWSTAAVDSFDVGSPTASSLGLTLPPKVSSSGSIFLGKQTLGSELGSEFGEDWGQNAGNYHLRASSLYNLTQVTSTSRENTPSPTVDNDLLSLTPTASPPSESGWEDIEDIVGRLHTVASSVSRSVTPVKSKRISLVIDPPTPSPSKSNRNLVALREARSIRNQRLSETVRARTNRWVEGRFPESSLSAPLRRRRSTRLSPHASKASDASMIFSETFDVVVRQLSFSGEQRDEEDEDTITAKEARTVAVRDTSTAVALPPKREGVVGFILEVLLWLQFTVVVMVFLWAMARRGPKSVLQEAEKRRASGSIRR